MGIALSSEDVSSLTALRRRIHANPELAFNESATSALVVEGLTAAGYAPQSLAGTGVVAVLDSGRPGRTVMLRADMDALPVQELNEHDYRSQKDGRMHACGHDGHTAIMLTVARRLAETGALQAGKVVFVFQPAEETGAGAKAMIDAGLLRDYAPDCCGGLHLWSEAPTGEVLVTNGPFMASMDRFEVTVTGRGGHGAIPQNARDPIVAAAQMITALQTIVARNIDPLQAAVMTVGSVRGGDHFNVIPQQCSFSGTVRTFSETVQAEVQAAFTRVLTGVAGALDVAVDIDYRRISLPVINAPQWCDVVRQCVDAVPGAALGPPDFRTMGAEDMAYFLQQVPGVYFFVGAGNPAVGATYPHHHPRFEIDEGALPVGVGLLCEYAIKAAHP